MAGYSVTDAPEEFFAGTKPEDWSESDRLAAGLAYEFHRWKHPYFRLALRGPEFRLAAQRAHNYREAAKTLLVWANMLDLGELPDEQAEALEAAARGVAVAAAAVRVRPE